MSAIRTTLTRALERREWEAEAHLRAALHAANIPEGKHNEILQTIGRKLTWILWDMALDEVDRRVR